MTEKMEGILMDEELDLVVGGAKTAVCIPDPEHEGKFIVMQSSESGDVDKMKKLLSGGSVDKIQYSGSFSRMTVSADKLEAYIERLKSRGVEVIR